MRKFLFALAVFVAAPATAQQAPAADKPITIESYYLVKWGSGWEFVELYERNEAPLLREMQRQGFITALTFEEPYTHMAGGPRWDFRARITYRDAAAAVEGGGAYDKAFAAARERLLPDKARWEAEQSKRLSLLQDHWDVIVNPVELEGK